jgi:hypothetical protein
MNRIICGGTRSGAMCDSLQGAVVTKTNITKKQKDRKRVEANLDVSCYIVPCQSYRVSRHTARKMYCKQVYVTSRWNIRL